MPNIEQICFSSGKRFIVDEYDQAFYQKTGVPLPRLCFEERLKRKMRWRNERNLYRRQCDLCSADIISMYKSDSHFTVYCPNCWWSDKWDAMDFAQDMDWSRPFFDQMHELQLKVPRLSLYQKNNQNCDFTNHTANAKDCYMSTDTAESENIFHSKWAIKSRDLIDSYSADQCELGYELQYVEPSYNLKFAYLCVNVNDSAFMFNCKNVQNSFMCHNLSRKEYCIRNEHVGKEAFEAFMNSIELGSHEQLEAFRREYLEMIKHAPKRQSLVHMCEECTGDTLDRCKNAYDSFEVVSSQDCRYCVTNVDLKDCFDTFESAFHCERQYECHGCNNGQFIRFGHISYDNYECDIIDSCHNSSQLFGCVSLRRKKFCILNKQYTEEEYRKLVPKLIAHMEAQEEWGEFFPSDHSPFTYEESSAQDYFPRALPHQDPPVNAVTLPDNLSDTPDSITEQVLHCEVTGRPYKIIPQELALHRKLGIALPRRSPNQRYMDRLAMRQPFELHYRKCSSCSKDIRSSYGEQEVAPVFCHECYTERYY